MSFNELSYTAMEILEIYHAQQTEESHGYPNADAVYSFGSRGNEIPEEFGRDHSPASLTLSILPSRDMTHALCPVSRPSRSIIQTPAMPSNEMAHEKRFGR